MKKAFDELYGRAVEAGFGRAFTAVDLRQVLNEALRIATQALEAEQAKTAGEDQKNG